MNSRSFHGGQCLEKLCAQAKRANALAAAQDERKNLSRLADEVMKHQWSNSREAMTALQELMDALPKVMEADRRSA
jgi:hypothetical protein